MIFHSLTVYHFCPTLPLTDFHPSSSSLFFYLCLSLHSNNTTTQPPTPHISHLQQVEACTFEQYEVYAIDVAMTSGDGKPKEHASRTTVLKRLVDMKYGLKVRTHAHTVSIIFIFIYFP